jgi:hypothetical protein
MNENPEFKAKRLEHLNRLELKSEFKAKRLEHLDRLNSSPKHKEHLKRIHSMLSHQVSVLDSLNNETIIYPSVSEAAQAIGVTRASINLAFKRKGESTILIKKRYQITKLPIGGNETQ